MKKEEKEDLEPVLENLKRIFDKTSKYIKTIEQFRSVNNMFWDGIKSININIGYTTHFVDKDIKSSLTKLYEDQIDFCYSDIASIVKSYKEKGINIISEYYDALDTGSEKWKCDILIFTRVLPKVLKYKND